ATKIVTFNGGAGEDVVTAWNNQNNTINTYDGADEVFLGTGRNTVDLGLGNDVVWLGDNINIVDLGIGGTDTVHVVAPTNGNTYSSIFNAGAGDILDFAAAVTNSSADFQQGIVLQPTAGFRDYLNAATAASVPDDAANWFAYLGNTYIVQNVDDVAATFQDGTDVVVQLVGLVDLSTATVTGGNILLA
ncbi:MAG: hypothetical protein Q8N51_15125, partial [Gammaproteobacteria bacterium]|nr:hypothetical protein [Gammaproteobacteria bacterium]